MVVVQWVSVEVQGGLEMLRKWWDAGRLQDTEELGDILWPHDNQWALQIYIKSQSHATVSLRATCDAHRLR